MNMLRLLRHKIETVIHRASLVIADALPFSGSDYAVRRRVGNALLGVDDASWLAVRDEIDACLDKKD